MDDLDFCGGELFDALLVMRNDRPELALRAGRNIDVSDHDADAVGQNLDQILDASGPQGRLDDADGATPVLKRHAALASITSPSCVSSRTGDAIDTLASRRHGVLAPSLATVLRTEHLRLTRRVEHNIWVVRMERTRHHGALRLDRMVEPLPRRTGVGATADRAGVSLRRYAEAGVDGRRILRRHPDVTTIGQRRKALHRHVLPMLALVMTREQAHARGDDRPRLALWVVADGVSIEHAFALEQRENFALQFGP